MLDVDNYSLTKVTPADQGKMDFAHLPAAKWYVEATPDRLRWLSEYLQYGNR